MDIKGEYGDLHFDPYAHHHVPSAGSSGSGARQGSAGAEAGFKCEHPGCHKTFTRKDHLVRHKANHSVQNHYCNKCGRAFKRLDLLQRHEKRQICQETNYSSKKRQRTASTSSESDSQPPLTASSQSFTTSLPTTNHNPLSLFPSDLSPLMTTSSMHSHHHHNPGSNTIDPSITQQPHHLGQHGSNNTDMSVSHLMQPGDIIDQQSGAGIGTDGDHPGIWANNPIDTTVGFGAWPPESWETLFSDSLAPFPENHNLMIDMQYNATTPRLQESAERGQPSIASAALVIKLSQAFPDVSLNLAFVTESLKSYWANIAPTFPFIHHGTFDLETAPNELVLMMIIVGSMYTPHKRDFISVVARIRGVLVQNCGLDMPNSTLQCFTLCHVHDTWFGTVDSQFIAQCLWPVMVAHSRKKGIGVTDKREGEIPPEEEAWAAWAQDEERRRAVYCILLMDTQLSAFWNQHVSRQLSIFAHNVALPCPRGQWEALTAGDWLRVREAVASPSNPRSSAHSSKQKSGYLPGLHPEFQVHHVADGYASAILGSLAADSCPFTADLDNALTVEMVVMGLMAIAWDCRTRGGMGIKFKEGTKHWRTVVMNAVIHVRMFWENNTNRHPPTIEMRDMRDTMAISIISVLSDLRVPHPWALSRLDRADHPCRPMLQVAAGATQVCGSHIGQRQYNDAKRRLRLWAKTDDAWTCIWQSTRYLKQALFADWGLYSPWAVFMTTLVAWGYGTANSSDALVPSANPHENANTMLDHVLSSPERVDVYHHGLADLMATSASLLDAEGAGTMQRDSGRLIWRLLGGDRDPQGRRQSTTFSNVPGA